MSSETTNVEPGDLNYDHYKTDTYDHDIVASIPGHTALHEAITDEVKKYAEQNDVNNILELGIGTGLTAEIIMNIVHDASLTAIDFSEQMLNGAKKRLGGKNVQFVLGDYSETEFPTDVDMIVSVIGIHHQSHDGKIKLFKKIFESLRKDGIFIFGDLVTYSDEKKAALSDARHFHYLVENARNEESLAEWAHHHKFLNNPASIEDQVQWLKEAGFTFVEIKFEHFNTALIVAKK